jgi:hypothetical protein
LTQRADDVWPLPHSRTAARRDELNDEQDQDRNHPRPPLPTCGVLAILAAARRANSWAERGRLSSVAGAGVLNAHGDYRGTVDGSVSAVNAAITAARR